MKALGILSISAFLSLSGLAINANHPTIKTGIKNEEVSDPALFSEDFEDALTGELANDFTLDNGMGLVSKANELFPIAFPTVASNNYTVDFDLKFAPDKASTVYVHLIGLDNAGGNMYVAIEGNGAYLSMRSTVSGGEVYNNGGDFYGGLNYNAADLVAGAHFEITTYEGYVELSVDHSRRFVANLSAFGGTQYQGYPRTNITKGTLTAVGFHVVEPSSVLMDNIEIREAKRNENYYSETNASGAKYSILGASSTSFGYDNFRVGVNFTCNDITKSGTNPAIKLEGLNGSLFGHNVESSLNFQFYDDGAYLTPQLYTQNTAGTDWAEAHAGAVTNEVGKTYEYVIEVVGDAITTYWDGIKAIETSFSTLGITKGHLQYVMVRPAESGYSWTAADYKGFDKTSGAIVKSAKAEYTRGSRVEAQASVFGDRAQSYLWYVDGVATSESGLTYATSELGVGNHTLEYKNDSFGSNALNVLVSDGIVTISADSTEIYSNGTVIATAAYQGDFSGITTEWYLDGVKTEQVGETASFAGLGKGDHEIYAMAGTIKSNVLAVKVLDPKIVISSPKSAYALTDVAEVKATSYGFDESAVFAWYINGSLVEGAVTSTLAVDMSKFVKGQQIIVKCAIGDTISNEFVLTVYYDIAEAVTTDPNYQILSQMEIAEGQTYGSYLVGKDDDGTYLYADPATVGPNCPITGKMPTSSSYTYEYKLFVPSELTDEYYVYPCLIGADSKYPNMSLEVAFAVNATGMRPYIKDQGSNTSYDDVSGAVIADYTYENGCARKGAWNQVVFAVQNKSISVSLNGTPVLFFTLPSVTVPTGLSMNWWSNAGSGSHIPLKAKDIKIGGLVMPAPELESISLSSSAVVCNVGESVSVSALINPYNAEVSSFDWYINDVLQETHESTLTFVAEAAGTYNIVCKVGDISSTAKTITVNGSVSSSSGSSSSGGTTGHGCAGSIIGTSGALAGLALVTIIGFAIRRKKAQD